MGKGTKNFIRVLMVGFAPGFFGSVFRFLRLVPMVGGTSPFRLKLTKAFLTGRRPGDWRPLMPRTFIETWNSRISTCSCKCTYSIVFWKLKSSSTIEKLMRTSPAGGDSGLNLRGCHYGVGTLSSSEKAQSYL